MDSDGAQETMRIRVRKLVDTIGATTAAQLIDAFLAKAPHSLAEMRRALAAQDLEALAWEAHALRGTCGVFGLEYLMGRCEEVERLAEQGRSDSVSERLQAIEELIGEFVRFIQVERGSGRLCGRRG